MTNKEPVVLETVSEREQMDAWLEANCGKGIPHGEATTEAAMLHGLAYILRQIEATDTYRPHIGQTISATSALRMALDHFAASRLAIQPPDGWQGMESAPEACHLYLTYWDEECAEWIVGVEMRPWTQPWSHWQPLPAAPNLGATK